MAKRPLEFHSPAKSKMPKTQECLSPSGVTAANDHAVVTGVLTSLSPIKPSRYFDGELTDGDTVIRIVGFDRAKRQRLQSFSDSNIPVTLRNCLIHCSKYNNTLEIVLKTYTQIEPSEAQFNIPDLKTVGSTIVSIKDLDTIPENQRVTIKARVIKFNDPQNIHGGKTKQDIIVADDTGKATLTLWGDNIGLLKQHQSYQLNRLQVKFYLNKPQLSFLSTPSFDELDDPELAVTLNSISDEESDSELHEVIISGIRQLESVTACIVCNRSLNTIDEKLGQCSACDTVQKLSENTKQTAKLIISTGTHKVTLKAHEETLRAIANTDNLEKMITPQDLLYAPVFNCTFNQYNTITKVSRQ